MSLRQRDREKMAAQVARFIAAFNQTVAGREPGSAAYTDHAQISIAAAQVYTELVAAEPGFTQFTLRVKTLSASRLIYFKIVGGALMGREEPF